MDDDRLTLEHRVALQVFGELKPKLKRSLDESLLKSVRFSDYIDHKDFYRTLQRKRGEIGEVLFKTYSDIYTEVFLNGNTRYLERLESFKRFSGNGADMGNFYK